MLTIKLLLELISQLAVTVLFIKRELSQFVPNVRSPDTSKSVVNISPSTVMSPDAVILVAPTSPLKKASLPVIPALVLIIQLADTVPKRVI